MTIYYFSVQREGKHILKEFENFDSLNKFFIKFIKKMYKDTNKLYNDKKRILHISGGVYWFGENGKYYTSKDHEILNAFTDFSTLLA